MATPSVLLNIDIFVDIQQDGNFSCSATMCASAHKKPGGLCVSLNEIIVEVAADSGEKNVFKVSLSRLLQIGKTECETVYSLSAQTRHEGSSHRF